MFFMLLQTSMSVMNTSVTDALTLMVSTSVNAMRDITTLQLLQPVLVREEIKIELLISSVNTIFLQK